MKIVLLCGSQHNQVALANKIAGRFGLEAIVIERSAGNKKPPFRLTALFEKILNKTLFISITNAWFGMLGYYKKKYPRFPQVETLHVNNINDKQVAGFLDKIKPDLVMVSGTSIVKKNILSVPVPIGIINLHTGLSPYIKGGPNCTNWCIAEKKFHLIGNTVMWIDAGIDSGDLLTTALTPVTGEESLPELHIKVMEHAHGLYLDAVEQLQKTPGQCPRVKQSSITKGTVYYNRQWNWRKKIALQRNFKKMPAYINSEQYLKDKASVITVAL